MRIAPSRRAAPPAVVVAAAALLVGLDFTGYRGGRDGTPPEAHVRRYARGIW